MKRRLRLLLAATGAALLLGASATSASAEPVPQPSASGVDGQGLAALARSGPWEILAGNSGGTPAPCLEILNGSTANNARVAIGHCAGVPDRPRQMWYMNPVGSYWQLTNYHTFKCLYPENSNPVNNAAISQETCLATDQWQHWSLIQRCQGCGDDGEDFYIFVNRRSGKCINHRSTSTVGTIVLQYTCGAVDQNLHDLFNWRPARP